MSSSSPNQKRDAELAVFQILERTFSSIGEDFFRSLVRNLCRVLKVDAAWVTEYVPELKTLRSRAFWHRNAWVEGYEYKIPGTPCEPVVEQARLVHYPDEIIRLFPLDPDLPKLGAVSYMGVPLMAADGTLLGHLAVLDSKPMPADKLKFAALRTFAARATSELRRLLAEAELSSSRQRLQRVLDTAMDAVIELDRELKVSQANPAALKLLAGGREQIIGCSFLKRLEGDSGQRLTALTREVDSAEESCQAIWIPGGLTVMNLQGDAFQTESTLSHSAGEGESYYTMVLRNVEDRLKAERRIQLLTQQTRYLEGEIASIKGSGQIIGESPAMLGLLSDLRDVARTNSTVLIEGETGTGKELVARAVHAASPRSDKPLITLNCAAIPSTLVESELFGHEKGAFTGALERRDGRFALADGATIFLDEVGELSLDVQAKLLRVLQEGEVTPVGSSRTRRVDVRVLAATNRSLKDQVQEGEFREDLFYRLNVFPLRVPPLRDRGDDIVLIATALLKRIATRLRKPCPSLSPQCIRRLKAYSWPGNVRELQNVIERSLITSPPGTLDLDTALSHAPPCETRPDRNQEDGTTEIFTAAEMRELEKQNILRALESSNWKVSGKQGAARLLRMKPTTLSSRIKALDIRRPS